MSVPLAALGVVIIWSTTPLAIQWSGEGAGFLFGVTARMALGAVLALLVLRLAGMRLWWHKRARATYLAAGLGIYAAMLSVYWAAQFIPSGWISVLFGLSPLVTGLLASRVLGESRLDAGRFLGIGLGLSGLVLIFYQGGSLGDRAQLGIAGVLASVLFHSLSAVWVKRHGVRLNGLVTTSGGLLVAAPLFLLTWFLSGGGWPAELHDRTLGAIVYLGVFGSVLGFTLYFYVLRKLSAVRVSLLTLVTPVSALLVGHWFNDEPLRPAIWWGAGLISLGLLCFEWRGLVRSYGRRVAAAAGY